MGERRATGALEQEVMAFLWSVGEPVTPADVHKTLVPDLAYTTVMTILSRLWQKGLLERERAGRAYAYRPVRSEADHRADEMRLALERSSDRAAVLSSFMDTLDADDAEFLKRFVKRGRRR